MNKPFVISMKAVFDAAGVKAGTAEAKSYLETLNRAATRDIEELRRASADASRFTATTRTGLDQALGRRSGVEARKQELAALTQTITAERALETERLGAQITERGRAESLNRLAALGRDAEAVTNGLAAAERDLAVASRDVEQAAHRTAGALTLQAVAERNAMASAQARINASYGIGRSGRSPLAAEADIAAFGREMDGLRAKFNPVYSVLQRYRAELTEIRHAHAVGAISTDEMTAAINRERTATLASIAAIKGRSAALIHSAGAASYQMRNLQFQMIDIAQGLPLLFASPTWGMLNLANQGAQIAQIWGPDEGGVGRAFKETTGMVTRFASKFALVGTVATIAGFAIAGVASEIDKTTAKSVNMGDVMLAALQVTAEGIYDAYFKPYADSAQKLWDMIWSGMIWVTKTLVNSLVVTIGTASGSVEYAIQGLWILLKGTAGTVQNFFADALQSVTDFITGGINSAIENINDFIRSIGADKAASKFGLPDQIALVGKADFSGLRSTLASEAQAEFAALNKTYGDLIGFLTTADHSGNIFNALRKQVDENLSKPTEAELEAAEKLRLAYQKIVTSVDRKIAALRLEARALGMTALEADKLRFAQELLNQAEDAGIRLTPDKRAELTGRATLWAEETEQLRRLTEAYEFGRSSFRSFLADIKSGLSEGKSLWESFGSAVAGVFDRIADRALQMAADGIWDLIFGSMRSLFGGGFGFTPATTGLKTGLPLVFAKGGVFPGGSLNDHLNTVVTKPTVFAFAKGGTFGLMGEAGDEAVMPLMRGTDGRLGVVAFANDNRSGGQFGNIVYAPVFNFPQGSKRDDWERFADSDRRKFDRAVAGSGFENRRRARSA